MSNKSTVYPIFWPLTLFSPSVYENNMAVKSANWRKFRKARLPITVRTRLVIYLYERHAHSSHVVIMYMIGSLLYVYSSSSEYNTMYKNYTQKKFDA